MRRKLYQCLGPMLVVLATVSVSASMRVTPPDSGSCGLSGAYCAQSGLACTASDGKSGDCVQQRTGCECAPRNICHLDRRSHLYAPIRVSSNAIQTHLRHGDCQIDDGLPCTLDRCDRSAGCVSTPDDDLCEDGLACTSDSCLASGSCVFLPMNCDDANACTEDSCDPSSGCVNAPTTASCDDDGNPCTEDSCDPVTGECVHTTKPDGASCSNGLSYCTVDEFCLAGVCGNGHPRICPPNETNLCLPTYCDPDVNACASLQIECPPQNVHLCCDPFPGNCVQSNSDCPSPTTRVECYETVCFATEGICKSSLLAIHTGLGDPCEFSDQCLVNADCTDNDACTAEVCAQDGAVKLCKYPAIVCDDNNACTDDYCDPAVGCEYWPRNPLLCADDVACSIETCDPAQGCESLPDNSRCDDGLACTTDQCAPTGCVHAPDPSFCGNHVCDLPCGENAGNCPGDCVGQNSCQGLDACTAVTGTIGNNSCNGVQACLGSSSVGDGSCDGIEACRGSGNVGNGSCNTTVGSRACGGHTGSVGDGSCNGTNACADYLGGLNSGNVGNNSCNADYACCGSVPDTGNNACNLACECDNGCCE